MAIRLVSSALSRTSAFSAYEDAQDDQLIALLQAGDDRAFETLMNRHRGIIWRVARQYLGHLSDADDLFQDVSLSFYQNRHTYQSGSAKFSSWLYRVATNRCLDILRARSAMEKSGELSDSIPSTEMSGEDNVNRDQLSRQLQSLLDELPLQQKLVLSLYYYEEKDISDMCQQLEMSECAVRSLIKRGKERLRQIGAGMDI